MRYGLETEESGELLIRLNVISHNEQLKKDMRTEKIKVRAKQEKEKTDLINEERLK